MNKAELSGVCRQMRRDIINMTANAGSGHPGGSLSAVELVASVFYNHMRIDPKNPHWADRDRFVLSKGHAAPCYYAVLAELGFISRDEFKNFRQLHSILLPAVEPFLLAGCAAALGMSWKAGVAAEVIGVVAGSLGERLYDAKIYLQTADLLAWTVVIVALSALFERLVLALLRRGFCRLERGCGT